VKTSKIIGKIPFPAHPTREIKDIKWINNDIFLAHGKVTRLARSNDTYTFFDASNKKVLFYLWGSHFCLSPDKTKIVYRMGLPGGYIPPQFDTHYVELAEIKKEFKKDTKHSAPCEIIYPDPREDRTPYNRHKFISDFYWSKDSKSIVFVERCEGVNFLIILDELPHDLPKEHKRFRMPIPLTRGLKEMKLDYLPKVQKIKLGKEEDIKINDISWQEDNKLLIKGFPHNWLVDLNNMGATIIKSYKGKERERKKRTKGIME
jgi:hypothetical protein